MEFLHLCYTPLTTGSGSTGCYVETIVSPPEHHHHHLSHTATPKKHVLRSTLLKREEEILLAIEKEFQVLGGFDPRVGHKDTPLGETFWTKEVQVSGAEEGGTESADDSSYVSRKRKNKGKRREQRSWRGRQKLERSRHIEEIFKGANRSLSLSSFPDPAPRQLLFDMLPEEQQQIILRKKYFRKLALSHRKERNQLVYRALFHRWFGKLPLSLCPPLLTVPPFR
jgi:hypothetical protein